MYTSSRPPTDHEQIQQQKGNITLLCDGGVTPLQPAQWWCHRQECPLMSLMRRSTPKVNLTQLEHHSPAKQILMAKSASAFVAQHCTCGTTLLSCDSHRLQTPTTPTHSATGCQQRQAAAVRVRSPAHAVDTATTTTSTGVTPKIDHSVAWLCLALAGRLWAMPATCEVAAPLKTL